MNPAIKNLSVVAAIPTLKSALRANNCAVLTAPPGSGKTTAVPLELLEEPWMAGKRILMLEPRRMAARAAAWRLSDNAHDSVGGLIGYQIRLESCVSGRTRITILTEGLLWRKILSDPELDGVGLIIFDEFHERSINADFSLALALDVQRAIRPDIRLLVMSATLNAQPIAQHLTPEGEPPAPIVEATARTYPVKTSFLEFAQEPSIARRVASGIQRALHEHDGSVLAFLPGEGEIRSCVEILTQSQSTSSGVDIFALYAALPKDEQEAALRPSPAERRKVVLATSIAESSLTIEGISSVVDCGMARISEFSASTGMSHLATIRISRDRADQRRGRAGRLGPGFCYRLWSEDEDRRLAPSVRPEITIADLASVALACADWGNSAATALPWLTPPPLNTWNGALELLKSIGALDEQGTITPHGRTLATLGIHPRLAHMLLNAGIRNRESLDEAALIAAALSENIPHSNFQSSNIEHLLHSLKTGEGPVSGAIRSRVTKLANSFVRALPTAREPSPLDELPRRASAGELLALAFPDRVARKRQLARDDNRYLMVCGRGAQLSERDSLRSEEWIVVTEIDDSQADGTIRLAAPIESRSIELLFANRFTIDTKSAWNPRLLRVDASSQVKLGSIVVKDRPLKDADPEDILRELCKGIRAEGINRLGWDDTARALQQRALFVRRLLPEEGVPDMSDAALAESLEDWLGDRLYGVRSLAEASSIPLLQPLEYRLGSVLQKVLRLAPTHITTARGTRARVDYSEDPPSISLRIQEAFGMQSSPVIAGGKVRLVTKLLSPAMRPMQITSDLANFWREGYPLLRKELRGRYPRHKWPEDPLA